MDLDTLFQDEFNYFKLLARDFSSHFSELDDFFSPSAADPGVERLIEGAAFLFARLRQKIDDEFPEITQGLLREVWSTPLRPLPATSVVEFKADDDEETFFIPAGAQIKGYSDEDEYTFITRRDLTVLPLTIIRKNVTHATDGTRITLSFKANFKKEKQSFPQCIPLFLSSDSTAAGFFTLWLKHHLAEAILFCNNVSYPLPSEIISFQSPKPESLVYPGDSQQFWRLQLLQEFFYTPHVNDFAYLDLKIINNICALNSIDDFSIELKFNKILPPDCSVDENSFRLYCTPIINLFNNRVSAIPFAGNKPGEHHHLSYQVLPNKESYWLSAICKVYSPAEITDSERGEIQIFKPMSEFLPTRFDSDVESYYYELRLEKDVSDKPAWFISFFDSKGEPVNVTARKNFICEIECVNNESVLNLNVGDVNVPGSDIPGNLTFENITPLSTPYSLQAEKHWPVISHLSLSPLLLNDKATIQQVVKDFDIHADSNLPQHEKHKRYLSGIAEVSSEPIDRLIEGFPVRGLRFDLHLDPSCYLNEGEMYRFGSVLADFFAYCISDSSFITTTLINVQSGERLPLAPIQGTRTQI
ncbi:type VI secretion system baseplate subunit TssF [Phytobacter massiliensis]|uniref:type VI secretion system baseplate subunit TssF n=1 Tax=Phytobacter massiliensis TaxID=1485952 RepID=UPI00030A369B|nr:type VI secretion system baseplate subunit TssF [Phytobacter massiliensis]